jgi:DNA processing protein
MNLSPTQRDLLALCEIHDGEDRLDWSMLARESARTAGVAQLLNGEVLEKSATAAKARELLPRLLSSLDAARDRVAAEVERADAVGARLVTVLDESYPANLRLIPNLPPFLFLRGVDITENDLRAVCVVGTRQPSPRGVTVASSLATQLVERGVTVVSGLAKGIDAAAHRAALDAGGRTIAVIGTGITRTYPKENLELSEEIAERGLLVSQFWPSSSPARWTFPRRNVVMSGIAQGTAVVEAGPTSGAKMQARLALEHGKRVFLMHSLVTNQKWAETYLAERGALEVSSVEDILENLAEPHRIRGVTDQRQLTLDLA